MSGPLTGVKILDFTQLAQGPFATQLLGDMGAEILKVEPPKGDWMRHFAYVNLYPAGESISFLSFNRNKRSLVLNLKDSRAIEIVKRMTAEVDVVVENFRPGVMERLGIGYEILRTINPRLVFCSSSGFGANGPYAARPGQDLLIQSMTGGMSLNGNRGDYPMATAVGIADLVTGLHIVHSILAALQAIIDAGRRDFHFVSWGGGLALELMLAARAVRRLSFCFCSLDVFGLAPLFRKALEEQSVEVEEWTALAMIQGFHAAQQQLPSMPFQLPVGSDMMQIGNCGVTTSDPINRSRVGAAPPLPMDVFLLHAQRADADGNVEIQGARGLDMSMAWAAQKILVTVEEVVRRGSLQSGPRGTAILPHNFITAIAECPWGAYPASCIPYYPTDYRALLEATEQVPARVPALTAARARFLRRIVRLAPQQVQASVLLRHSRDQRGETPPAEDEIMAVAMARMYDNDSICAVGAVSPLAMVSYLLAKRLHAPDLVIMPLSSGLIGIASRPMTLLLAESLDTQTAFLHCGGDDTYHQYYQRGLVTHEVVSAAQIDRLARTNNIAIRVSDAKTVRLPGQGGMADVANMHQNFLLYMTRHSPRSLVSAMDHVSAARGLVLDEERKAAGYRPGTVRLVTNLGIFELNRVTRLLELVSVHPGVSIEQVAAATGFPLQLAQAVGVTEPPTRQELDLLRHEVDPLGIRRLEFIPSKERTALLTELLDSEEAAIQDLMTGA